MSSVRQRAVSPAPPHIIRKADPIRWGEPAAVAVVVCVGSICILKLFLQY